MPTSRATRHLLATAAIAVLAVLVGFGAILWTADYMSQSAEVLATAHGELLALGEEHAAVGRSREALAGLVVEQTAIASSFVQPQDPLPLIERIEALGKALGVLTELAVSPSGESDTYVLTAAGSFTSISAFLGALEHFDFFLALGEAEIRRAERPAGVKPGGSYVRLTLTFQSVHL